VMHERALGVDLAPDIEAECIRDLSQHCSDMTAKSEVCSLHVTIGYVVIIIIVCWKLQLGEGDCIGMVTCTA